MSKIKYTEEIKLKAIELRLEGKSSPEIVAITGMGKESQNKLFRERGIKLSPEAAAKARERRWLNHKPIVDGHKECSKCSKNLPVSEFGVDNNKLSKLTSWCNACAHDYYQENSEHIKARVKEYKDERKEEYKEKDRKLYKKKPDYYLQKAKEWDAKNPEKRLEITNNYGRKNQKKKNARSAAYRAQKLRATPPWLTQDQKNEMRRIYENCPPGYHVDHIMPLKGENLSGLHVPWNLQYLPKTENLKKGNKVK